MRATTMTTALVGAALAVAVPAAAAAATHHAAKTTTVTVAMSEFKFKLSKPSAPKGAVVFKVSNKGSVAHDFKINGKKTPLVGPGKSATLKVTFTKTGKFTYLCSVPGHAASGM
jgi:uncharacterized cupredoxin-like copper-binding protein